MVLSVLFQEVIIVEVLKVINNNIVSALDENNEEVIVMGKGLGYRVKLGQPISEGKIEKMFRLNNPDTRMDW